MSTQVVPRRPSEARERLLRTASGIFYARGVHAVGVEEILARAQVTRATFYRHFPSKDDLILAYLHTADQQIREAVAALTGEPDSTDRGVRAVAGFVVQQIKTPGFRGCAFLNAAAEYPDPNDPIHQAILSHRSWFFDTVTQQFARICRKATPAAEQFVMLRDGAMAEGCLSDPQKVARTFLRGVDGVTGSYRST